MNIKIFTLFLVSSFFTLAASAQTIEENIKRQMKDIKMEENRAKADALLIDKTLISDSAVLAQRQTQYPSDKKRKCIKKNHHKH